MNRFFSTRLFNFIAVVLLAVPAYTLVAVAQANASPVADSPVKTQSSTNIIVDENGSTAIQSETTTVLPGGVIQQQTSTVSSQSRGGVYQYRTICIASGSGCQTYVLECPSGNPCEYRQIVPYFNVFPFFYPQNLK